MQSRALPNPSLKRSAKVEPESQTPIERLLSLLGYVGFRSIPADRGRSLVVAMSQRGVLVSRELRTLRRFWRTRRTRLREHQSPEYALMQCLANNYR